MYSAKIKNRIKGALHPGACTGFQSTEETQSTDANQWTNDVTPFMPALWCRGLVV